MSIKSKEKRKCQEWIQLVSHLTQNTLWESDKRTRKRHIQKRPKGQLRLRAVAMYLKVVRWRKPSSVKGTKGWRALEWYHSTLTLAPRPPPPPPPPEIFFEFLALLCSMFVFLMGFNVFGTRLQSIWIMILARVE